MSTNKTNKRRDELNKVSGGFSFNGSIPAGGLKVGGNPTFMDSSVRNIQNSAQGKVCITFPCD